MTQISFYDDGTGEFIKQWPNWTGIANQGDRSMIAHFERITRPVPLIDNYQELEYYG